MTAFTNHHRIVLDFLVRDARMRRASLDAIRAALAEIDRLRAWQRLALLVFEPATSAAATTDCGHSLEYAALVLTDDEIAGLCADCAERWSDEGLLWLVDRP